MARERNGYVFQNKKGAWYARTTITDDNGKRRYIKKRAKDKQDAKRLLKSVLQKLDAEGVKAIDFSKLTFNDLANLYEADYCKPATYVDGKKVSGLRDVYRAKYCLARFRKFFGKRRLREISYRDLHAYYLMRLGSKTHFNRPPNIATMNRELGVLRRIFNIAAREGWIMKNPFNAGEPLISPASERRRERVLTIEEERRLLEACQRRDVRALFICLLDTGARLSEILRHLRWRSVCFASRTLTLEAMTTKTLKARQVSMTERTLQELRELWTASSKEPDERVFERATRLAQREFAKACKAAGVKYGSPDGITLHSLRHTAATRLVQGGMPLQLAGRILGHSQVNTTYRYLSANDETLRKAAAILEEFQTPPTSGGELLEAVIEVSEAVN
jgi:integrase